MAVTNGWGKATQNNTNGYGKYQNTIGAASVYAVSAAGETVIEGTSAAFTYAKSSYHQDESDPTPTITGTAGGTFSGTSGIVFVDSGTNSGSSTGQVDLSASTIQANTITYTVLGVSANFSLSVTASPFLANTYSMEFDAASSQYIDGNTGIMGNVDLSTSYWIKTTASGTWIPMWSVCMEANGVQNSSFGRLYFYSTSLRVASTNNIGTTNLNDGNWHHIVETYTASTKVKDVYVDGNTTPEATSTLPAWWNLPTYRFGGVVIGNLSTANSTYLFDGNIDEVAVWNTILSTDAITEIYNATNNNTGKALDLTQDSGNYNASSNLQYFNRMGD